MANFNEQLPDWEATGVEPPASKKTAGWQPDDKPPADWFNWFFNRAYKVMQEIRTVLGGHVDAAAPHSGHETPAGAQTKASLAEANAKNYTDGHAGTKSTHGVGAGYYVAKTSRSDQLPAYADIQDKPTSFPPSLHTHSGGDITSKVGSASAADSVPWSGVSEKPGSFAPSAHKSTHASGGSDALTPADIGAAPATAGGVTDTMIGNRTVSDAVPPTGDAGTITTLFSWLANMIKSITGKSNWRTAPATTLEAANTHINATSVHSATSAATANRIMMRDAAGRAKVAAPSASDDIARKSEVDTVQTNLTNHLNAADPHAQYALDSDLDAHKADTVQHITAVERTTWNAKVDNTDYLRSPGYAVTAGSSTAYTITLNPAPSIYADGQQFTILPHVACGANPTFNVNGLGASTILNQDGSAISAGDILANKPVSLVRVGSNFFLRSGGGNFVKVDFNNCIIGDKNAVSKITNPTALSNARRGLAATAIGNYALFGGGYRDGSNVDTVDAYDASLTRTIPTVLSNARGGLAATTIGNYALFGGGSYLNTVDAYNTSLTRTTPTALSIGRYDLAATAIGNYALFGGGYTDNSSGNTVDAYDASLTRTIPTVLSNARGGLAATTIGNYALFGGGYENTYISVVDAYNTSLTRTNPIALSNARDDLAATAIGNYALFGGGDNDSCSCIVDAYNASLTRTTPTELSRSRGALTATSIGNYALFGGGYITSARATVVDAYDTSLTRTTPTALSIGRDDLAATAIGNYALFGGGHGDGSNVNTVDAYANFNLTGKLLVTVGSKYDFGSGETTATTTLITANNPATGYIKYKKGTIS